MFQIERGKVSIVGSLSPPQKQQLGTRVEDEKVSSLSVFRNRKFDPYFHEEKKREKR